MSHQGRTFVLDAEGLAGAVTRFAIVGCALDADGGGATLKLRLEWEIDAGVNRPGSRSASGWRVDFQVADLSQAVMHRVQVEATSAPGPLTVPFGTAVTCSAEASVQVPLHPGLSLTATLHWLGGAGQTAGTTDVRVARAEAPQLEASPIELDMKALRWLMDSGLVPASRALPESGSAPPTRVDFSDAVFGLDAFGAPGEAASTGSEPLVQRGTLDAIGGTLGPTRSRPTPPPRAAAPPAPRRADPRADVAVFCPPVVSRGTVFLVQVLVYQPERASQAQARAQEADAGAQRRGVLALPPDLPRGTRLDLRLEMPALRIDEPDAVLLWNGATTAAQFEVAVPDDTAPANAIGRVRLSMAGVPVGTLRFQVSVVAVAAPPQPAQGTRAEVQRYRRAFVSYSSKDRAEVLRRVQAFRIAGLTVFQDLLDLEPGQRWERALYREIDRCDVLLLFWSSAAAASPWVAKEIDYALALQAGQDDRPPAIAPVPIEGPPIPPPPDRLRHLHFNDALLAHIAIARQAGERAGS